MPKLGPGLIKCDWRSFLIRQPWQLGRQAVLLELMDAFTRWVGIFGATAWLLLSVLIPRAGVADSF